MLYSNSTKVLKIAFLNKFNTMCWFHFSQFISLEFRSAEHFLVYNLLNVYTLPTHTHTIFIFISFAEFLEEFHY